MRRKIAKILMVIGIALMILGLIIFVLFTFLPETIIIPCPKHLEEEVLGIVVGLVGLIFIVVSGLISLSSRDRSTDRPWTETEFVEYSKILKKEQWLEKNPVLIEYWKKVKETIHLFDEIIVKYVIQWSAILLAIIGASTLVFSSSTTEVDYSLLAAMVSLSAILISIPIAVKCYFYYELLEEALRVAEDVENVIFGRVRSHEPDIRLTHRLTAISTRKKLGITFFGWTIFIPFAFLFAISLTLMVYYFSHYFIS